MDKLSNKHFFAYLTYYTYKDAMHRATRVQGGHTEACSVTHEIDFPEAAAKMFQRRLQSHARAAGKVHSQCRDRYVFIDFVILQIHSRRPGTRDDLGEGAEGLPIPV